MGLGSQGLAGTTQGGSLGDATWKNLEQKPGVTDSARTLSQVGRNVLNTTSNIAPAAALGGAAKMLAPSGHGAAAASAAPQQAATFGQRALQTGKQLGQQSSVAGAVDRGRNFLHNAFHTADQLTEHNNPLGVGAAVAQQAVNPGVGGH
jgi:hypothetical protein